MQTLTYPMVYVDGVYVGIFATEAQARYKYPNRQLTFKY